MTFSDKGKRLLMEWEGCVLHVYKDQAGYPTIGVGHLLTKTELLIGAVTINGASVALKDGLTPQQAIDLLAQDIAPFAQVVNQHATVTLTQDQFDALVIFAYNVGAGGFANSTLLKELNRGQLDQVPAAFMLWSKVTDPITHQHVTSQGLVNRRQKEIDLFEGRLA